MSQPWYVRAILVEPERVLAHLGRMRARGVVDVEPTPWQLCLGVLRLWHRLLFRTETVGTSPGGSVRRGWRARALHPRAVRLPFLLAEGAVVPFDFTGLRSDAARVMRHLLGAHHDGAQFVYDLELLTGHDALPELRDRVAAVLDGRDPRASWLRDLAVFDGYHEQLASAVDRALTQGATSITDAPDDPDLTLRGAMRWCARQPATPRATFAAWRAGTFRFDSDVSARAAVRARSTGGAM